MLKREGGMHLFLYIFYSIYIKRVPGDVNVLELNHKIVSTGKVMSNLLIL